MLKTHDSLSKIHRGRCKRYTDIYNGTLCVENFKKQNKGEKKHKTKIETEYYAPVEIVTANVYAVVLRYVRLFLFRSEFSRVVPENNSLLFKYSFDIALFLCSGYLLSTFFCFIFFIFSIRAKI